MKKSIIFQSIITMLLIIVIAGFGVYALLISNTDRKSQVVIDVKDQSINVGISGSTSWGDENDSFQTQTGPSGIVTQVWDLKDLRLTEESVTTPETIQLKMHNFNQDNLYEFTVRIEGVAYDEHKRFDSEVVLLNNDVAVGNQVITKNQPVFEKTFSGSTETFEFVFKYSLRKINSSFSIAQDITITLTTQWRT